MFSLIDRISFHLMEEGTRKSRNLKTFFNAKTIFNCPFPLLWATSADHVLTVGPLQWPWTTGGMSVLWATRTSVQLASVGGIRRCVLPEPPSGHCPLTLQAHRCAKSDFVVFEGVSSCWPTGSEGTTYLQWCARLL